MRFNKEVYIVRESPGTYDRTTGNYTFQSPKLEKAYVDLQEDQTEINPQDLGGVAEETITVTFQQPPKRPFTAIRYKGKDFKVESSLYPRNCTTFILKEVR